MKKLPLGPYAEKVFRSIIELKMKPGAFRLYCLLKTWCIAPNYVSWVGYATLAKSLHTDKSSIHRWMRELDEFALIKIIKAPGDPRKQYIAMTHVHRSGKQLSFSLYPTTERWLNKHLEEWEIVKAA